MKEKSYSEYTMELGHAFDLGAPGLLLRFWFFIQGFFSSNFHSFHTFSWYLLWNLLYSRVWRTNRRSAVSIFRRNWIKLKILLINRLNVILSSKSIVTPVAFWILASTRSIFDIIIFYYQRFSTGRLVRGRFTALNGPDMRDTAHKAAGPSSSAHV